MIDPLTYPVPLPYDITPGTLKLDPAAHGSTMDEQMDWLNNHISWSDERTMFRIFSSTVVLFAHLEPEVTLGECLHTALIWECG
jgi:hypothetical protein